MRATVFTPRSGACIVSNFLPIQTVALFFADAQIKIPGRNSPGSTKRRCGAAPVKVASLLLSLCAHKSTPSTISAQHHQTWAQTQGPSQAAQYIRSFHGLQRIDQCDHSTAGCFQRNPVNRPRGIGPCHRHARRKIVCITKNPAQPSFGRSSKNAP